MRLKKGQREKLLGWIAEGLRTDEINARAAGQSPTFIVSRQQVDHYRKTRSVQIEKISESADFDALSSGLALRAERVKRLVELAESLEIDIFGGLLWVTDVKSVGFERVEIKRFNSAEVSEYRGILKQIADEVGDNKPGQTIPTEITVIFGRPQPGLSD